MEKHPTNQITSKNKFELVSSEESDSEREQEDRLGFPNISPIPSRLDNIKFSEERSSFSRNFYKTVKSSARKTVNQAKHEFILIFNENRTKQVGFAALSVFDLRVVLGQVVDSELYSSTKTLLRKFSPLEIYLPKSQRNSVLAETIRVSQARCKINFLMARFFEENKGFLLLTKELDQDLPMRNSEIYLSLACLNCLSELIKGDSIGNRTDDSRMLRVADLHLEFYQQKHFLKMDPETIRELRILDQSKGKGPRKSLIGIFRCLTVGGFKLLRADLIQPPKQRETIDHRLEFVGESAR